MIYADRDTRVLVQGITGAHGAKHTKLMLDYGTDIVAGVTPGKSGTITKTGVPVFDTVSQAVRATGATASVIFVPPVFAMDAMIEAIDAGLELCVCITDNVPALDMLRVKAFMKGKKTRLIGPNCPGVVSAGASKIGIMPNDIHLPGHVGVVSRSGSLTYETIKQLTSARLGQSSAVGIGGDAVKGTSFLDVIKEFSDDPETYAVVMLGEIGGDGEERTAEWIKNNMKKPVAAFINGRSAPAGKRMGHAGAVVSGGKGTALSKVEALNNAGVPVARTSDMIGKVLKELLQERGVYKRCLAK